MRSRSLLAAALLCAFAACNEAGTDVNEDSTTALNNDTAAASASALFDGSTLTGWHTYGKTEPGSAWNVDSGAIHLQAAGSAGYQTSGGGDLVSNEEYEDFDLQLDWKISKNGNSGILLYVQEDTAKYKETYFTGPEIQVLDNNGHPDAKIIKHRAADLYDLITSTPETVKPVGEWNKVRIRSEDSTLTVWLNGTQVVTTKLWDDNWRKMVANSKFKQWQDFGTFTKGHIVLQDHGNEVWYRNINIERL